MSNEPKIVNQVENNGVYVYTANDGSKFEFHQNPSLVLEADAEKVLDTYLFNWKLRLENDYKNSKINTAAYLVLKKTVMAEEQKLREQEKSNPAQFLGAKVRLWNVEMLIGMAQEQQRRAVSDKKSYGGMPPSIEKGM